MHIGVAMRAFVIAHDFADNLDFASAVVTNHNSTSALADEGSGKHHWEHLGID
jgi:hypothetical protein